MDSTCKKKVQNFGTCITAALRFTLMTEGICFYSLNSLFVNWFGCWWFICPAQQGLMKTRLNNCEKQKESSCRSTELLIVSLMHYSSLLLRKTIPPIYATEKPIRRPRNYQPEIKGTHSRNVAWQASTDRLMFYGAHKYK